MLALRLLWQKVVRPLVWIIASIHFIEFIVSVFKTIGEFREGLRAAWPIGITVVWTLGSSLWTVGGGATRGFYCALIAIPLAEWPILLVLAPMRLFHLRGLSLFSAAARARAYLDDGNTQVTMSFIGSVGGMIFVMVGQRETIWRIINPPPAFEVDQLAIYGPGLGIILVFLGLGVKLYLHALRWIEPYKTDLEGRLSGHGAVAVGGAEGGREPGPGQT